jgi:hypothetical protein
MLAKAELDDKILVQLINHDKKMAGATMKKVSIYVQMLTLFMTSLIITN